LAKTIEIDHNQNNIYQLVNIDLTGSNVTYQAITFSFQITALQQRDKPNTNYDSKLLSDTNYLSNMNETHFVLNRFINVLMKQDNDEIYLLSNSDLRPLRNFNRQDLDGWQFTVTFQLPNTVPSC
jgi:predicted transposase YbfD/YdcC